MRRYRDVREYRAKLLQRRMARQKKDVRAVTPETTIRTEATKVPRTVEPYRKVQSSTRAKISFNALPEAPKFSILTGAFNCGSFLGPAIDSIIAQTYTNWELIICNDASTDNTLEIASSYANNDSRIKVISNTERQHCAATYARLVHEATGELCGVMDGDDALAKDAMEWIVKVYQKYINIGYIYTQFWICDTRLNVKKKGFCNKPKKGSLLDIESKGHHYYSHWRTFRTELREKNTLFKPGLKSAVDKYLGYILEETAEGGFFGMPLYFYRRNPSGISVSKGKKDNRWSVIAEAKSRRSKNNIIPYPITHITI
jgi:glycosyltransferase involved in cell wall biosynthesis